MDGWMIEQRMNGFMGKSINHSINQMTSLHLCLFVCVCVVLLKVYCSDHTYTTIRVSVLATGREVTAAVADKLGSTEELLLINLSASGGGPPTHTHTHTDTH